MKYNTYICNKCGFQTDDPKQKKCKAPHCDSQEDLIKIEGDLGIDFSEAD